MATIGQSLFEPESGWKRIDNEDLRIIYNGNFTTVTSTSHYNGSIKSIENNIKNNSIEFYLRSNRLRLISYVSSDTSYSNNVNINIDGVDYTSTLSFGITRYQTLVADINIHNLRTHKIIITDKSNSPRGLNIDAIDVDEDGELIDSATYYSTIDSMKGMFEGCTSLTKDGRIPLHINNVQELYKNCTGMTHIISNWKNPYDNPDIISTDCYAGCNNIQFVDNIPVEDGLDEIPIEWGGRGFDKTVTGIYRVFIPSDNYTFVFESTNYLMDDKVVKWGDGTSTQGELSHTYRYAGEYIIKGKIQMLYQGVNPCVSMRNCCTEVIQYPTEGNTWGAFIGMSKVTKINVTGNKLTNKVDGIEFCFAYCASLSEIIGLETWDVSSFTNFHRMFYGAKVTNTSFNISNWNLNKAINLSGMFADCPNLINPPITNIPDTVTNISEMYRGCTSLTNVDGMTFGSGITNCTNWIYGCTNLVSANNITLRCFTNDGNNALFQNCTTLLQANNITIESSVYKIAYMFKSCSNLQSISFSNTVNDTIQNVQNAFYGCSKLVNFNWGAISLINCNNVDGMFYGCSSLTQITMPQLHPSQPIRFVNAFYGTSKLTSVEFYPSPITLTWCGRIFMSSSVTSISNFIIADVSDTSQVDSLRFPNTNLIFNNVQVLSNKAVQIFQGTPIKSIIGDGLKIGFGVTDASTLFNGCSNLTSVTLKDYNNSSLIPPTTMPSTLTQITFNGTYNRTAIQNILKSCPWQINVVYGETIPTTLITKDINMNKSSETQFTNLLEGSSKTLEVYGNTIQNLVTNPDNTEETCRYIYSGSGESFTINDTVDSKIRIDEIQGNTVQNWFDSSNITSPYKVSKLPNGNIKLSATGSPNIGYKQNKVFVKPNTRYTIKLELVDLDTDTNEKLTPNYNIGGRIWFNGTKFSSASIQNKILNCTFVTLSDTTFIDIDFQYNMSIYFDRWMEFKNIAILEGDYSTKSYEDIFKEDNMDGIRSVGVPVENPNLFNPNGLVNEYYPTMTVSGNYSFPDPTILNGVVSSSHFNTISHGKGQKILLKTNTNYVVRVTCGNTDGEIALNYPTVPNRYILVNPNETKSYSFNSGSNTECIISFKTRSGMPPNPTPSSYSNIVLCEQSNLFLIDMYPNSQELYQVDIINTSNYLWNRDTDILNKLQNGLTGVLVDNTSWNTTDFIKVPSDGKYYINMKLTETNNTAPKSFQPVIVQFDSDKNLLPRDIYNYDTNAWTSSFVGNYGNNGYYKYHVDNKTCYIRISYPNENIDLISVSLNNNNTFPQPQGYTGISKSIYLPCQLQKVGTYKDRLYWDKSKGKWSIEKGIAIGKPPYTIMEDLDDVNRTRWLVDYYISGVKIEESDKRCITSDFPFKITITKRWDGAYYGYANKSDYPTVGDVTNALKNSKIYYELNTKNTIELPYTDSTLLELNTYPTQTNIYSNAGINPNLVINSNGVSRDVMLKPSTKYTVNYTSDKDISIDLGGTKINALTTETKKLITTPSTLTHGEVRFANTNAKLKNISVVEGDYMAEDNLNYIEGIQSVGEYDSASGKYKVEVATLNCKPAYYEGNKWTDFTFDGATNNGSTIFINHGIKKVETNKTYTLSQDETLYIVITNADSNKGNLSYNLTTIMSNIQLNRTSALNMEDEINTNGKCVIKINYPQSITGKIKLETYFGTYTISAIYISKNEITSLTSIYSNTKTFLLDEPLRKIGDVADKLYWDNNKGYYCVERNFYKKILNGSESWIGSNQNYGTNLDRYSIPASNFSPTIKNVDLFTAVNMVSDKFICIREYLSGYKPNLQSKLGNLGMVVDNRIVTPFNTLSIKNWLSINNVVIIYELATPIIQDLPTYNQNVGLLRIWQDKTVIDTSNIIKPSKVKFVVKDIT